MCPIQFDKKQKIVSASRVLFAQFGLRKTSVDEIAKRARVAKATIYKYFHTKEDIFVEVVRQEATTLMDRIHQAVEGAETALGKMKAYLVTKLREIRQLVNFYKVTRDTVDEYWPHVQGARESFLEEEKELLTEIFNTGIKEGELAIRNPEMTAQVIVTALKGVETPWLLDDLMVELDEFVDTMLEVLFKGIGR